MSHSSHPVRTPELWLACVYADQCNPDTPVDTYVLREKESFLMSNHDQVAASILDALATESRIHESRHQRVALSVTAAATDITLCVSHIGGSADRIVGHLYGVLEHVRRIRDSGTLLAYSLRTEQLTRDFELFLMKFSFEKVRRRILKHIDAFVAYVPPETGMPWLEPNVDRLRSLVDEFRTIRDKLPSQGSMSDTDLYWLMERIKSLYREWYPDLNRLQMIDRIGETQNLFPVVPYLRKIWVFRRNCLWLGRLATTKRLSTLLDGHWVVQVVPPSQRHIILGTRIQNFVPVITSVFNVPEDKMIAVHGHLLNHLIRITALTGIRRTVSESRDTIDFGIVDVHPECVLLAHHKRDALEHQTPPPFPYVGTSKPPCRGCQHYLDGFSYNIFLPPPRFNYRKPFDASKPAVVCFPWAAPLIYPEGPFGDISPIDIQSMEGLINELRRDVIYCLQQIVPPELGRIGLQYALDQCDQSWISISAAAPCNPQWFENVVSLLYYSLIFHP